MVCAPATPSPAIRAAAAEGLPDLGDAAQIDLSPMQERKLGETVIRQLRAAGGYMNDPEVNDYLNELGHRLLYIGGFSVPTSCTAQIYRTTSLERPNIPHSTEAW